MSHIHTWGKWRRVVLTWDTMHTTIITSGWAELSGVEQPVTPGWSRICQTCRNEEQS